MPKSTTNENLAKPEAENQSHDTLAKELYESICDALTHHELDELAAMLGYKHPAILQDTIEKFLAAQSLEKWLYEGEFDTVNSAEAFLMSCQRFVDYDLLALCVRYINEKRTLITSKLPYALTFMTNFSGEWGDRYAYCREKHRAEPKMSWRPAQWHLSLVEFAQNIAKQVARHYKSVFGVYRWEKFNGEMRQEPITGYRLCFYDKNSLA